VFGVERGGDRNGDGQILDGDEDADGSARDGHRRTDAHTRSANPLAVPLVARGADTGDS